MPQSLNTTGEREYRNDTLCAYQRGVERAILVMRERLGEPLSVDDLADAAFMSRFHFTRVFSTITSVSPARFLAAIRMQEAKKLLLKTDLSVTEVSLDVGYNSLGTFTRIFAAFVGFSPIRFRQLSHPLLQVTLDNVTRFIHHYRARSDEYSVHGEIVCASPLALATVAVFPTSIPRSHPIECVCLKGSLRFSFNQTPPRGAVVFAAGLLPEATVEDALLVSQDRVHVGATRLLEGRIGKALSLEVRPRQMAEPPVVVAFPLLIAESLLGKRKGNLGQAMRS